MILNLGIEKEYKTKSQIITCGCGHNYIKTRQYQKTCLLCIDREDIPKHHLLKKKKSSKIKSSRQCSL